MYGQDKTGRYSEYFTWKDWYQAKNRNIFLTLLYNLVYLQKAQITRNSRINPRQHRTGTKELKHYHVRFPMKIGRKIKKIRELRNFTQEYLALQLNISQAAYHKIESDKTNIALKRLEEIARILRVSVVDILNMNEEQAITAGKTIHVAPTSIPHDLSDKEMLQLVLEHVIEQQKHLAELFSRQEENNTGPK